MPSSSVHLLRWHLPVGPPQRWPTPRPVQADHSVSRSRTYSYWHFEKDKYPVQKVIEQAAGIGFDGVELLHVQMDNETPAYVNSLKQAAFRHGLALPMLSIHQDFVSPDPKERQEAVDHTKKCIGLAAELGIPAVRLNSGRWNTIKSFDDLMKVKGNEPPIAGYTDEDAFKWCIDSINAVSAGRREPTASCSRSKTTGDSRRKSITCCGWSKA